MATQARDRKFTQRDRNRLALFRYYEAIVDAHVNLTEEQRDELAEWERVNLDGHSVRTSDWPGWAKYTPEVVALRPYQP